jgi:hypothetical protein
MSGLPERYISSSGHDLVSMSEKRCWFCGRDKAKLIADMPEGFWDEFQDMFLEIEVVGKVNSVDKAQPGDPPYSHHFRRPDTSPDVALAFDERRFAVVSRKCAKVCVCRVCRTVEAGLPSMMEGKSSVPHRSIYAPGSEELAVAKTWERVRNEEKRKVAEYPEEAYRTLKAIQKLNSGDPISLWDLSKQMRIFNHRTLERPISHILSQYPALGKLDQKSLVLHINDPAEASAIIEELIHKYDAFYDRQEAGPATPRSPENDEVLARIKHLNR